MKNFFWWVILLHCSLHCFPQSKSKNKPVQIPDWQTLTIREKVGQTAVVLLNFELNYQNNQESVRTVLQKYPVGAMFMGNWLIPGGYDSAQLYIRKKIKEYSENSKIPILFQEDYESGLGHNVAGMSRLPNMMAVGAANSTELAFQYGNTISSEARSLGFNWLLHPVVDLNYNYLSSLVSTRCMSDDPDKTIKLVSQQMRAMQTNGVAATIKHFPGDGVDFRDQHTVTTINSFDREKWDQTFGKVYKALIDSGAASVMIGHISLPAYQSPNQDGTYMPATLSKELITGLLKNKLGFTGVVVSDAMNMGGVAGYYHSPLETQIQAFLAGCDMILWPTSDYIDTLEARIIRKEIPIERLNDAVSRIWEMKKRFGLFSKDYQMFTDPGNSQEKGIVLSEKIANSSITLVRDVNNQFPLKQTSSKTILWNIIGSKYNPEEQVKKYQPAIQELEKRGFLVETRINAPFFGADTIALNKFDKIIYAFDNNASGTVMLYEDRIHSIWLAQVMPKHKLISISFGTPYYHNIYLPNINTCVNAYNSNDITQIAVIRAITGEIEFKGSSPVNLLLKDIPFKQK